MTSQILALLVVLVIVIIWYVFVLRSPYFRIGRCEGMLASQEQELQWLVREVDYDNVRVEKCNRITGIIENRPAGIVQPTINEPEIAGLRAMLADRLNRLAAMKAEVGRCRAEIAKLNDMLSMAAYDLAPAAAMKLEDDIGALNMQIANIKIDMARTRSKIKTLEDQILAINGEVPFNHYNNYFNVCRPDVPF